MGALPAARYDLSTELTACSTRIYEHATMGWDCMP